MRQSGFDKEELNKIERDLNQPPPDRVAAVKRFMEQNDVVSAEIVARLLVENFPEQAEVALLLQEVLAQALKGVQA